MTVIISEIAAQMAENYDPVDNFFVVLINDLGTTFTFTADPATDTLTTPTPHGFAPNTRLSFGTTGALPAPLNSIEIYFVANPAGTTFQVSATAGGPIIDLTSAGTGTQSLFTNPLDDLDTSMPVWVRQEILDYGGGTRPVWLPSAPVVNLSTKIVTVSGVVTITNSSTVPVEFNVSLIVRGGTNAIGNTAGVPVFFNNYNPAITIPPGEPFTINPRVRKRSGQVT